MLIGPRTRAIVYNDLQNPIGAESSTQEREAVARLALEHDLWVLSDEAYFEMRYSGSSTSIAQLPGMAPRTVILYTFSKKFAMTGWRLGAAVAPAEVAAMIAKLNTRRVLHHALRAVRRRRGDPRRPVQRGSHARRAARAAGRGGQDADRKSVV